MPIEPDMLVDGVMRRWPTTIRIFIEHRMHCVGCPIACFHTIEDAAREHGLSRDALLADLRACAAAA